MGNKEFGQQIEKRTLDFAVRMIRLSSKLPNTPEGRVVRNQITKCGTSIGANYREANRSRSKADFRNRIRVCEGEASETQYWMKIIIAAGWLNDQDIDFENRECGELLGIFTSAGSKMT